MAMPVKGEVTPVAIVDCSTGAVAGISGGALNVNAAVVPAPPGTVITMVTVLVPAGGTIPLPAIPANTTRMTVQNKDHFPTTPGGASSKLLLRQLGGAAGEGTVLTPFQAQSFGAEGGSIAALEVENPGAALSSFVVTFES